MRRLRLARSLALALPITATTAVLGVVTATPAAAHERRAVGAFQFAVGWGDEPAYTGFKNSVQVTLSEASGGAPVTDVGDSLKVEVVKGTDRATLPLEANFRVGAFGTPGDYRAWLAPTRPGTYSFHFTGSVRGQSVDETFTSSKTTFDDVDDVSSVAFPAKDPSTGQVAARLDRELPRLDTRTGSVEAGIRRADDRAGSARALAAAGMVVGLLGLLTAAAALVAAGPTRRRVDATSSGGRDAAAAQPTESVT